MKRLINIITRKFSGFLSLFIVGIIAYILSGDLDGLFKWIWTFKWLIGPLAIMIILVPFWPAIKGAFGEYLVRNKLSQLDPAQYKVINNLFLHSTDRCLLPTFLICTTLFCRLCRRRKTAEWIPRSII